MPLCPELALSAAINDPMNVLPFARRLAPLTPAPGYSRPQVGVKTESSEDVMETPVQRPGLVTIR